MELLTVAEIARRLNIPESTARYYRDRFAMYIPVFGEGKSRRYRPETLDIIRIIADSFRSGMSAEGVENELKGLFAVNVESQQQTATTQQLLVNGNEIPVFWGEFQREFSSLKNVIEKQNELMIELVKEQNELMKLMLDKVAERDKKKSFWKKWL